MKTYIMLLRGINVGGNNILPMKKLVALLLANGVAQAKTYIQSGNVVLQSHHKPGAEITEAIANKFGFKPSIMLLEQADFLLAAQQNPFPTAEGKFMHFYFAEQRLQPDVDKLSKFAKANEQYEIQDNVFYLHAPDGIGRSKLVANIDACLGVPVTGRNLNTMNKLLALVEANKS